MGEGEMVNHEMLCNFSTKEAYQDTLYVMGQTFENKITEQKMKLDITVNYN